MYQLVHQLAFVVHVAIGSLALIVFWLPLFVKKGGQKHVQFGRYFVFGMYAISISGFIMTVLVLIDPIAVRAPESAMSLEETTRLVEQNRMFSGFLLMLSILVFNSVKHSILVLKAKADRSLLKTPSHLSLIVALAIVSIIMGIVGTMERSLLFQIFAGLGLANAIGTLHYIYKANLKPREWILAHLGAILGAGIGAYTAFFVFGGSRIFSQILGQGSYVVLWVTPGIVGTIASIYLTMKYRQQYKVA